MRWRVYFALIKQAGRAWIKDGAPSMGAALAFYSAFSIAPLLIIVIGVAGAVYGVDVARGAVEAQLTDLMGPTAAAAIQALLLGAQGKSTGVIASVIGVVTLLIGATTVLVELQTDFDRIWSAPPRKGHGAVTLLRSHATSLGLILGIGFLLLVSLVVTGTLAIFGKNWGSVYPGVASSTPTGAGQSAWTASARMAPPQSNRKNRYRLLRRRAKHGESGCNAFEFAPGRNRKTVPAKTRDSFRPASAMPQ